MTAEPISRRLVLAGLGALSLAACTPDNSRPSLVDQTTTTRAPLVRNLVDPAPAESISQEDAASVASPDLAHRSIVATASTELVQVFAEPDGEVTHEMSNPTPTGGPLVFLMTTSADEWLEVLLPVRPNGSTGWIRSRDITLTAHHYRIAVDLNDFRLRVFDRGDTVFDAVAGVAAENSPTPGGRYYLTELLAPPEPDTIYGSFAYGLSGFSDTFETFNGGPGQLGIHGTNSPEALGTNVSSGCIRLHNEDVARLVRFLPLGVPVDVT
jgi:lipoprotein-anchoring transpeptidase ErfK/SrfK